MSLQKCKKCDLTKHISDYASSGSCPVDGGNHEFEFYNNSPFLKVSPLSPETLEKMRLENEKHHCSKCGWERLLWRPQDKCAHVLICPLCLMTRPHSSQECDKYTGIRIEKLEVQVEVYRKALEAIHHRIWRSSTSYQVLGEIDKLTQDALLTSKPEPVAPVRKWEAKEYVGLTAKYHGQTYAVYFEDLLPEVQDALNGRKA